MKSLQTQRLILRSWTLEDVEDLYDYAKSDLVGPSAGWPIHKSVEDSLKIIKMFIKEDDTYAIELKETGKVIGGLGIHEYISEDKQYKDKNMKEIGFVLNPEYWGNAYVPEAAREAIKFAFSDLKSDIVWCCHYDFNDKSKKVIDKCGFKYQFKSNKVLERLDNKEVIALYYNIEA